MSTNEIHVVPDSRGVWRLRENDSTTVLSEHESETAAERAAIAAARERADATSVIVHDRYARVHRLRHDR